MVLFSSASVGSFPLLLELFCSFPSRLESSSRCLLSPLCNLLTFAALLNKLSLKAAVHTRVIRRVVCGRLWDKEQLAEGHKCNANHLLMHDCYCWVSNPRIRLSLTGQSIWKRFAESGWNSHLVLVKGSHHHEIHNMQVIHFSYSSVEGVSH